MGRKIAAGGHGGWVFQARDAGGLALSAGCGVCFEWMDLPAREFQDLKRLFNLIGGIG